MELALISTSYVPSSLSLTIAPFGQALVVAFIGGGRGERSSHGGVGGGHRVHGRGHRCRPVRLNEVHEHALAGGEAQEVNPAPVRRRERLHDARLTAVKVARAAAERDAPCLHFAVEAAVVAHVARVAVGREDEAAETVTVRAGNGRLHLFWVALEANVVLARQTEPSLHGPFAVTLVCASREEVRNKQKSAVQ